MTPHTHREDTRRKVPRWVFLGGGSVPQRLNKDDPAVTAVATMAARKHDGTCKILNK
jgi:hypothetical protein